MKCSIITPTFALLKYKSRITDIFQAFFIFFRTAFLKNIGKNRAIQETVVLIKTYYSVFFFIDKTMNRKIPIKLKIYYN